MKPIFCVLLFLFVLNSRSFARISDSTCYHEFIVIAISDTLNTQCYIPIRVNKDGQIYDAVVSNAFFFMCIKNKYNYNFEKYRNLMYSLVMKKEIFNAFNDSAFAKFIFPLNVHSIADSLYEQGGIREIIDTYFSDIYVKKIDRDFFNLAKILFSEQYLLKHVEGSIAIIQYKCENGILLKNYGVN